MNYIVRDHDKATFEKRLDTLRGIEKKMNEKYHADTVKLNIQHSYSNMLEVIEKNEYVVANCKKSNQKRGLEPVSRPVRGGTDGARLSLWDFLVRTSEPAAMVSTDRLNISV